MNKILKYTIRSLNIILAAGIVLTGMTEVMAADQPQDWKDFALKQGDIASGGLISKERQIQKQSERSGSDLQSQMQKTGAQVLNQATGGHYDKVQKIQNNLEKKSTSNGKNTTAAVQKKIVQAVKDSDNPTIKEYVDTFNAAQKFGSNVQQTVQSAKNMDNTVKTELNKQKDQVVDQVAGDTIRAYNGLVGEVKGVGNDLKQSGQAVRNVGNDLKAEANKQVRDLTQNATGGIINEYNQTVKELSGIKNDLTKTQAEFQNLGSNLKGKVDSEVKDMLKVMDITGDIKGNFGSVNPMGNILAQAKESFNMVKDMKGGENLDSKAVKYAAKAIGFEIGSGRDGVFSQVQNLIGGLDPTGGFTGLLSDDMKMLAEAKADYNALRRNNMSGMVSDLLSQAQSDLLSQAQSDAQAYVMQKVKSAVNGSELAQLFEPQAMTALQLQAVFTKGGPGLPTNDPINMMLGVFNVESVYGHSFEFEYMRDFNTQVCNAMGVGESDWRKAIQDGSKTAGEYCCEQWLEVGANSLNSQLGMFAGATIKIVDALTSMGALKNYCCKTVQGLCDTVGAQKAECLNGALQSGATAEEGWVQCGIECGNTGYGELVYNPGTGYDPAQVEELVKGCYKADPWVPSPTVLSSSELAPVVPATVKQILAGGEEGLNTVNQVMSNVPNTMNDGVQNATGALSGVTGSLSGLTSGLSNAQGSIGNLRSGIQGATGTLGGVTGKIGDTAAGKIGSAVSGSTGGLTSGISSGLEAVRGAAGGVRSNIQGVSDTVGGITK